MKVDIRRIVSMLVCVAERHLGRARGWAIGIELCQELVPYLKENCHEKIGSSVGFVG